MNKAKAKLKTYASQARKDFIAAVTAPAYRLGLSDNNGQLQITLPKKAAIWYSLPGNPDRPKSSVNAIIISG